MPGGAGSMRGERRMIYKAIKLFVVKLSFNFLLSQMPRYPLFLLNAPVSWLFFCGNIV